MERAKKKEEESFCTSCLIDKKRDFPNIQMNYPGLKPWVSRIKDLKCLRFAPGGHSSPSLKDRGFLAGFIKLIVKKSDDKTG